MSAKPAADKQAKAYLAKVRRKPAKSEHSLQRAVIKWCRGIGAGMVRERFAAIPNGGSRGGDARSRMITGANMKAEGVRAGMPDLIFWDGRAVGIGCKAIFPRILWVEMKLGTGGRMSDSQKEVHASLVGSGFSVVIARDLASAVQAVINFYSNK